MLPSFLGGLYPRDLLRPRPNVPPTVKGLVDAFLLAKEAEGRAPLTLDWYRSRLATLPDVPLRQLDADALRRWLISVRAGRRGRATRETYVEAHRTAVGTLFTWAVAEGYLRRSPAAAIGRIRARRREIVILTPEEVAQLVAVHSSRTALGLRNRAMLSFLYDTGVRVGELVSLRLEHVQLAEGFALVDGKTGERRVPLGVGLRRVLLTYLQRARMRGFPFADEGTLFIGRHGRALHPNAVNQLLRRTVRQVGISKRVYPHLLRHSFGTQYIRNGGDPFTLQRILGHKTSAMVTVYMHMAARDVEERHASASPFDRILPMIASAR